MLCNCYMLYPNDFKRHHPTLQVLCRFENYTVCNYIVCSCSPSHPPSSPLEPSRPPLSANETVLFYACRYISPQSPFTRILLSIQRPCTPTQFTGQLMYSLILDINYISCIQTALVYSSSSSSALFSIMQQYSQSSLDQPEFTHSIHAIRSFKRTQLILYSCPSRASPPASLHMLVRDSLQWL